MRRNASSSLSTLLVRAQQLQSRSAVSSHGVPVSQSDPTKGKEDPTSNVNIDTPPTAREVIRGKEHFMLELEKMAAADEAKSKPKPNAAFISKLSELQADGAKHRVRSVERKERIRKAIEQERKALLVFRDVGMDLDKAILSRDVLLIPKYMYYGKDFAIDNELERMLRYFNEHAMKEIKIINDGKLMRGPDRLTKNGILFPTIDRLTKLDIFDPSRATTTAGDSKHVPPLYGDPKHHFSHSSASFKRPTVVIYTQLGQRLGGQADRLWREVALGYIDPKFAASCSKKNDSMMMGRTSSLPTAAAEQSVVATPPSASNDGASPSLIKLSTQKAVDIISLRSLDVQNFKWVHRMYVRRFVDALVKNKYTVVTSTGETKEATSEEEKHVNKVYNDWLMRTTYVGSGILKAFFPDFGLRNYLSPTVMIVDHKGLVRWMSGGLPDAKEKAVFSKLLQQVELEYYKERGGAGSTTAFSMPSSPRK